MRHVSTFDSQNLVLQSLGWSLLQSQIITRVEHQVPNGRKESFQSITRKNAFVLLWDSEICHSILENTSSALLQSNVTSSGRRLIQPEYETFLGLKLGLRLQETRPVSDAWNNEEVIPLPFTNWFVGRMRRDRFKVLLSHISGDLSFIEKRLQQNFLNYHWPHQWVALDETIIPYYGKNCSFLVSIPKNLGQQE
jgi:hypothetical protein